VPYAESIGLNRPRGTVTEITKVTIYLLSFVILFSTLVHVNISSASLTSIAMIASSGVVLQEPEVNAVVHKALLSWPGLPSGQTDYAAQFDWLYMGPETYQLIPTIRAKNSGIIIIGYLDVGMDDTNQSFPESCYMHDISGKRIYSSDGWPLMNISDPTWQNACASNAQWQISKGYDGVMADDTWANYYQMYGMITEPAPSGAWWNSYSSGASYTRWQTAMRTLLSTMKAAMGADTILVHNGGIDVYSDICDGTNLEDFIFDEDRMSQPDWIGVLETISATGKYVIAEPYKAADDNQANYIFGLSCYMLGMNGPNAYFCWNNIWGSSMGIYPSIINRDFGRPISSKVQVSANVWTRQFENCVVTVDFQNQTGQIVMK
jgi:hypothetical protein